MSIRIVHEFVADLIGNAFVREWERVSHLGKTSNCELSSKAQAQYHIPPPLTFTADSAFECDHSFPSLVEASFDEATVRNDSQRIVQDPPGSWFHTDEGRNKYGLVTTEIPSILKFPLKKKVQPGDPNRHRYLRNETEHIRRQTEEGISIRRSNSSRRTSAAPRKKSGGVLLEIQFLRTYRNAGCVQVFACSGKRSAVVVLDALWSNHYSQNVVYTKWLDVDGCTAQGIELVHGECHKIQFGSTGKRLSQRGNQKFKLGRVKMCHAKHPDLL